MRLPSPEHERIYREVRYRREEYPPYDHEYLKRVEQRGEFRDRYYPDESENERHHHRYSPDSLESYERHKQQEYEELQRFRSSYVHKMPPEERLRYEREEAARLKFIKSKPYQIAKPRDFRIKDDRRYEGDSSDHSYSPPRASRHEDPDVYYVPHYVHGDE